MDQFLLVLGVVGAVVVTAVGGLIVSASFRDTFVFTFTILVLLIRPQGLFGVRTFQRV